MDRHWLITWSTYGTWLPGDARGYIGKAQIGGERVLQNVPGTPRLEGNPGLAAAARRAMAEPPTWLTRQDAEIAIAQFRQTATIRQWQLLAASVQSDQVHVVLGVPGDPDPSYLVRDLKSYASRALNEQHGSKRRWWAQSASKRVLRTEPHVVAAVRYVREQKNRLAYYEEQRALPT
jgi:REP element-mobilizing transposase RayT